MRRTTVTDAQIPHLRLGGLRNLEHLYLSMTNVTDDGLIHLALLTNLRRLHLYGTRVSDNGAKELQQALPELRHHPLTSIYSRRSVSH